MPKILVNTPEGNQEIINIEKTGGYFDPSRVLWDERTDGPLPQNVTLGKMKRTGSELTGTYFTSAYLQYLAAQKNEVILQKEAELWKAADAYIYSTINGVGLSMLALGVSLGKPKALAVAAWCDSVWTEYYIKKSKITAEAEVDHDFALLGDKPYSVVELREEVYEAWTAAPA